jgi:hypothetical protein
LRSPSWEGAVWIFLPVKFSQIKYFAHMLGTVEVSGDVYFAGDARTTAFSSSLSPNLTTSMEGGISLIEFIESKTSRTAGFVYKISVALPTDTTSSNEHMSSASGSNMSRKSSTGDISEPFISQSSQVHSQEDPIMCQDAVPKPIITASENLRQFSTPHHHPHQLIISWVHAVEEIQPQSNLHTGTVVDSPGV